MVTLSMTLQPYRTRWRRHNLYNASSHRVLVEIRRSFNSSGLLVLSYVVCLWDGSTRITCCCRRSCKLSEIRFWFLLRTSRKSTIIEQKCITGILCKCKCKFPKRNSIVRHLSEQSLYIRTCQFCVCIGWQNLSRVLTYLYFDAFWPTTYSRRSANHVLLEI